MGRAQALILHESFARTLRIARRKRGLTQKDAAQEIGTTRETVRRAELGLGITFKTALMLARHLRIDLNKIRDQE